MSETFSDVNTINVLVYSDNQEIRTEVMNSVGRRVAKDLPEISWIEAATWEGAELKIRENDIAMLILDAETSKLGGIGLGKKVRDEIVPDMPYIVLIARPQDEWLARVASPNKILQYPIDPRQLSAAVATILTQKFAR